MLHKGFLKNRGPENPGKNRMGLVATNLVLYAGVCIILAGLFFMLINIDKADSMIRLWLPFMIAGVVLVFLSFLIRLGREWHHR